MQTEEHISLEPGKVSRTRRTMEASHGKDESPLRVLFLEPAGPSS